MKKSISLLLILTLVLSLCGGMTAFATEGEVAESVAEETTVEAPVEEPAEETAEAPAEEPTEETAELPIVAPAEAPVEDLGDTPAEELIEELTEEVAEAPEADPEVQNLPTDGAGESTVTYTEITKLSNKSSYVAFVIGASAWKIDQGMGGNSVTIAGTAPNRTLTAVKGISCTVTAHSTKPGGYSIQLDDPPGTSNYLYVDSSGTLTKTAAAGATGDDYAKWSYKDGKLSYSVGSGSSKVTYYLSSFTAVTTEASGAAAVALFTGSATSNDSSSSTEESTTDSYVPVITAQPVNAANLTGAPASPVLYTFTVGATPYAAFTTDLANADTYQNSAYFNTLNKDSDLDVDANDFPLTYQWYTTTDGGVTWAPIPEATNATLNVTVNPADAYGVYSFYCKVTQNLPTFAEEGVTFADHSVSSYPAGYTINNGTKDNSFIMFSDVHGKFDAVIASISIFMAKNNNKLPSLIVATGDFNTGMKEATKDEAVALIDQILARNFGIDTVAITGNHETGEGSITYAASAKQTCPQANKNFDGCDWLYESDSLIVYGINYTAQKGGYGTVDGSGVTHEVNVWLSSLTLEQKAKYIVFVAHAGLHMLDDWSGGNSYNLDNQTDMVDVLNYWAQKSNLNIGYFFGHNHSKSETEFMVAPGGSITSVVDYDNLSTETRTLNFTYGHAGFVTSGQISYCTFNADSINLMRYVWQTGAADGEDYATTVSRSAIVNNVETPVVDILADAEYKVGDKATALTATFSNFSATPNTYTYQWYSNTKRLTTGGTLIPGATTSKYTPSTANAGKYYYYCTLTNTADSKTFSTTNCVLVTVKSNTPSQQDEGASSDDWAVVIKVNEKYYALSCTTDGTLSAVEVTVENNLVTNPRTADLRWEISNPTGAGTVYNKTAGLYLIRTSGGSSKFSTTTDGTNKYTSWTYDETLHMLYSAASGGSTRYFYPAYSSNALKLGDTTTLSGDKGVYLMKFKVDTPAADDNKPAKDAKKGGPIADTGDDNALILWIGLAAVSTVTLGYVLTMKKKHN